MQTTLLYVELIIIGLEGSVGVMFAFAWVFGLEKFIKIISSINLVTGTVMIGFLYLLGLIFDRLSELTFRWLDNKYRKNYWGTNKSYLTLSVNEHQKEFVDTIRNKTRIVRAAIITSALGTVMSGVCIFTRFSDNRIEAFLFSLILGSIVFFTSLFSYIKMLRKYYERLKIIENENKRRKVL